MGEGVREEAVEGEGGGEDHPPVKSGLDPSTFTLVEAAQYGNIER